MDGLHSQELERTRVAQRMEVGKAESIVKRVTGQESTGCILGWLNWREESGKNRENYNFSKANTQFYLVRIERLKLCQYFGVTRSLSS